MRVLPKVIIPLLLVIDLIIIGYLLLGGASIPLLQPKGLIADQQFDLLLFATLLSLIAVVPVIFAAFYFAFAYKEGGGNTKPNLDAKWDSKRDLLWWAIPIIIIAVLALVTFESTHILDPYKPIQSTVKPLRIQVVALQWKWLFIYPEQGIASVNYVVFPEDTPIEFELTADAPMSSFWIPHLGGQIYAMEGMITKTHLMANTIGKFPGSNAEISGHGFAGMRFVAEAMTNADFQDWVVQAKSSPRLLQHDSYALLAKPSENVKPILYSGFSEDLYTSIVMRFMTPPNENKMNSMDHATHSMEH